MSTNGLRSMLHGACRRFGFDIVSLRNLDRAIDERDRQRRAAYIESLERLREQRRSSEGAAIAGSAGQVHWVNRDALIAEAVCRMQSAETVLDVGCAFRPQPYVVARTHICCEPFADYMERLRHETAGDPKYIYLNAGLEHAAALFPAGSVDSAFLIDVIEHVDRTVATSALQKLRSIVRKQLVLFTPIGYMPQEPSADGRDPWGMQGAEWQKHQSGWTPDDFPGTSGWTVLACRDFHLEDGYGRALDEPFGAMWAIWSRPDA